MKAYNDLLFVFVKLGSDGKIMYRFICHYEELVKTKKKI